MFLSTGSLILKVNSFKQGEKSSQDPEETHFKNLTEY